MNVPQNMLFFREVEEVRLTDRARSFVVANQASPVEYASVDAGFVTYRLRDGKTFRLTRREAKPVGPGRWHL